MASELQATLTQMRAERRNDFAQIIDVTEDEMSRSTDFTYETMMTGRRGEAPAGEGAEVRFIFLRYPDHLEEHAVQIEGILRNRFGIQQSEAQLLLRATQEARGDLFAALTGLTDDDLDVEPVKPAGEWPLRTILEHIIDGERIYTIRAKQALDQYRAGESFGERMRLGDIASDRSDATLLDFLHELDTVRNETLELLADVSADELRAPAVWAGIDIDLRFQILRYSMHDREHTAHIRKWRQQVGRPPTEADQILGLTWQRNGALEGSLIGASDEILDREPGNGEWTIRRILAHITRAEHYYTSLITSVA